MGSGKTYAALVGATLKRLRKARRLSQTAVATRLGITQSLVCRTEQGVVPLTVDRLAEYAALLQIPASEILRAADTR